ncbi:MAG: sugar ABC transporter substrate-binding protein [Parvibaculaceae bacterium]
MTLLRSLAAAIVAAMVSGAPSQAQDKPYDGVTIRIGTQASQWADVYKKMAPEFTKETGIKVEFDDISFDVMYEKLKTTFIGGAPTYDVVWYDSMWTPEFTKRGWIKELTPYLGNDKLTPSNFNYPDDFYATYISGAYPADNVWGLPAGTYGLPWIAGFNPLYYRTDLLAAGGFTDANGKAKPPETMDDLLAYAKKLNNPDAKTYGFVMSAKQPRIVYDWAAFLWTYGGDFFDKAYKPIFNSEAGVKSLEAYIELGKNAPPGVGAYHITEAWTSFMQGHAALAWTWQDLASVARQDSQIIGKFACAPPPSHNGNRVSLLGGIVASVPASAANPEPAFQFLTWAQEAGRSKQATLAGAMAWRKSMYNDPEVEEKYPSAAGNIEQLTIDTARPVPLIPEWSAVDQIIGEQVAAAFAGTKSAKEALDEAAARVEKFMREAGYN